MPIYRWPDAPIAGFLLGTFVLAIVCVVLGDLTFNLVVRADRKKITSTTSETVRLNNPTGIGYNNSPLLLITSLF